eukprot:COSAG01_NODE_941_length_12576_cov_118.998557_7_plen_145_part_00
MKSEPNCYSIDDLERDRITQWEGVRNYQARNFMMKDMQVGDKVLFYHSNAKPPGIAGLAEVCKLAYADHFSLDPKSDYFDPRSTPEKPIWHMVDVRFVKKLDRLISLPELKQYPELADMLVLQKGSRLSIQPVSDVHYRFLLRC